MSMIKARQQIHKNSKKVWDKDDKEHDMMIMMQDINEEVVQERMMWKNTSHETDTQV